MKKIFILLVGVVLICCAATAFADVGEARMKLVTEGFRGVPWGSNIENNLNFVHFGNEGHISFFARRNDELRIGEARLLRILYGSLENCLINVSIIASGHENFYALNNALHSVYGMPSSSKPHIDEYSWQLSNPNRIPEVGIRLEYNRFNQDITVTMVNAKFYQQQEMRARERARDAASDF